MKKSVLLKSLDKATDQAAKLAIKSGLNLNLSTNSVLIGNVSVEKNKAGFFDVVDLNKNPVYKNISLFDIATIIAHRHINGDKHSVKKLLFLEDKFSKYYTDMIHYLHCMKIAKKNKDYERLSILEDKFQTSEYRAKNIRDSISVFKRLR